MAKGKSEILTAKKFAERAGVTYPTIITWLKKGLVPKAVLIEDSPHGAYWQIPATSLDKVEKQKPGPKPAKKSKKGAK
jgi:predicted site-specific integrase-resolvase